MRRIRLFWILFLGLAFLVTGNAWAVSGTKMVVEYIWEKEAAGMPKAVVVIPHDSLAPSKAVVSFLQRAPQPTLASTKLREEEMATGNAYLRGTKQVVSFTKTK